MSIKAISKNLDLSTNYRSNLIDRVQRVITPAANKALHFATNEPLVTGGTFLTGIAFITSLTNKTTTKLLPVLGIPAISLFIYQIFLHSTPKLQTDSQAENISTTEERNTKTKHSKLRRRAA